MRVREIMTENPACCTPDTNLRDVAQMMLDHDCGLIPVVDSHITMKPVGTITDRDVTIRAVATNQNPLDLKASDIMTTGIVNVTPEMSTDECMSVMEDQEIRRVLVVDQKGALCGVVAQADVAQLGTNPDRTARMLREISESSPSRNTGRNYGTTGNRYSSYRSYLNSNSLLPLLMGLGTGAALMYFLSPEGKSESRTRATYTRQNLRPAAANYTNTSQLNNTATTPVNTPSTGLNTSETTTRGIGSANEEDTFVSDTGKSRSASSGGNYSI